MEIVYKVFSVENNRLCSLYCDFKYKKNIFNTPPVGMFFAFKSFEEAVNYAIEQKSSFKKLVISKCRTIDTYKVPTKIISGYLGCSVEYYKNFWKEDKYKKVGLCGYKSPKGSIFCPDIFIDKKMATFDF